MAANLITVQQAAARLGKSPSSIRTVAIAEGIGIKPEGVPLRLFSPADIRRLRQIFAGRKPGPVPKTAKN